MPSLAQQSCLNHPLREAVARCPECRLFYCRECITEHDDRVICAGCLKKLVKTTDKKIRPGFLARRITFSLAGVLTAWLFFYWIGQGLISIPTSFHDGTLWKTSFWEE
ncbi:MAG: rhomboid family protein [Verrucomicrobiota bacterium]